MDYFIHVWPRALSEKRAMQARAEIREFSDIDLQANPKVGQGNRVNMWLVRSNDGTHDCDFQHDKARKAIAIVENLLEA